MQILTLVATLYAGSNQHKGECELAARRPNRKDASHDEKGRFVSRSVGDLLKLRRRLWKKIQVSDRQFFKAESEGDTELALKWGTFNVRVSAIYEKITSGSDFDERLKKVEERQAQEPIRTGTVREAAVDIQAEFLQ